MALVEVILGGRCLLRYGYGGQENHPFFPSSSAVQTPDGLPPFEISADEERLRGQEELAGEFRALIERIHGPVEWLGEVMTHSAQWEVIWRADIATVFPVTPTVPSVFRLTRPPEGRTWKGSASSTG